MRPDEKFRHISKMRPEFPVGFPTGISLRVSPLIDFSHSLGCWCRVPGFPVELLSSMPRIRDPRRQWRSFSSACVVSVSGGSLFPFSFLRVFPTISAKCLLFFAVERSQFPVSNVQMSPRAGVALQLPRRFAVERRQCLMPSNAGNFSSCVETSDFPLFTN